VQRGCDFYPDNGILSPALADQDQKIAAFGSSYRGEMAHLSMPGLWGGIRKKHGR
jgi:hypothetical protein